MENLNNHINFDMPKYRSNVIKVIGVGGGGSNAINYMFHQGINGVDFIVTNTDSQALEKSPVPIKIQLGATLTEGLGAGANPEIGRQAAEESYQELYNLLSTQTKMVFITAGMGGGTGTGAAPIIAKMSKELEILTVGIVTMPFNFEGKLRVDQAQKGLEKLKDNVDSLIVINNNKLREVYGNLGFKSGFSKADEVLAKAARGIAEVITHHYTQNIDLKDANTVLKNSGSAIMGSSTASGSNRAQEAIQSALDSPLLNDNKITGCKNVLLLIVSGSKEITIDEIGEINEHIQNQAGNGANIIMGVGEDKDLNESISVTVIASGFNVDQQHEIVNSEVKKVIHTLEDDQSLVQELYNDEKKLTDESFDFNESIKKNNTIDDYEKIELTEDIKNIEVDFEIEDEYKLNLQNETHEIQNDTERQKEHLSLNELHSKEDELNKFEDDLNQMSFEFGLSNNSDEESKIDQIEISKLNDQNENLDFINHTNNNDLDKNDLSSSNDQYNNNSVDLTNGSSFDDPFEIDSSKKDVQENESISDDISDSNISLDLNENITENNDNEENIESIDIFDDNINETNKLINEEEKNEFIAEDKSEIDKTLDSDNNIEKMDDQNDIELINLSKIDSSENNTDNEDDNFNEEIDVKISTKDLENVNSSNNPFEKSINNVLDNANKERREQLKKFNYNFKSSSTRIDEMEKEPAYKRFGLDLDENSKTSEVSNLTIDQDVNDETQIRTNNSFLHDNVD
tara:strand:+ start:53673 stop:55898 length:2226 start_codon:yes stop_codon:yes gene_type:complete